MACVRRAVWGMVYADDAAPVSRSAEGLAIIISHCDCLRSSRPHGIENGDGDDGATNTAPNIHGSTARRRTVDQSYRQMNQFSYLGGVTHESVDLSSEIK